MVAHKSTGMRRLWELYENALRGNIARAIYTVQGSEEELLVAGQMQSMYLFPGLHETTIGEFMNQHPEVIKRVFNAMNFEYEPYLEWKEHDGTVQDAAINPDLMIQKKDGYYDIYDLKTALLQKKKLTKGERRRRRFIDYVEEGVSQLANYREYFCYEQNASHAKENLAFKSKIPILCWLWEATRIAIPIRLYKLVENITTCISWTTIHFVRHISGIRLRMSERFLIEPNIAMHQARLLGLYIVQIAHGGLVMASVSRSQ
jgi:hypothetical protein